MSNLLVVGSLAYDSIETPHGKVERALGGSANYFSLSASRLAQVRVVGVVGEDYQESDRDLLLSRGVDLSGVQKAFGKTFFWSGSYQGDMNDAQTKITDLNVFGNFDPKIPDKFKDSRFVFLANISPDLQGKVLDQVQNPILTGMDTMNFWISSKLPDLKKTISRVQVLLINEGEAKMLTNAFNGVEAAPRLTEMGPELVVIKRGEYGFLMFSKTHGFFALPAVPMPRVVDPTGAGDTFAGGFFGYLSKLNRKPEFVDYKMAAIEGTLMASFTIEDFSVKALAGISDQALATRRALYSSVTRV